MDDEKLTVEETMEILCALNGTFNFDESEVSGGNIALDEAIILLDRLISKKPIDKKRLFEGTELSAGKCPNCGNITNSDFKHCEQCGQALDWT